MGRNRPLAWLIIAVMAVGSVVMWLGVPAGWIFFASRIASSQRPGMGIYVMLIVGIPVSIALVGKGLSMLNRTYARVTGTEAILYTRSPLPWLRSMRGERGSQRPRTVLDVVMLWSVGIAVLCFLVWFFAFAGSPI